MSGIDADRIAGRLAGDFPPVRVVPSTGSTNADLLAEAGGDAPDRTVLIAEEQTRGRGRRARGWVSPPGSGLYLSVLLRPDPVPAARFGSLALVAGVALVRTARELGVSAVLKWPNDLLVGDAKCAGVLAEVSPGEPPAVVLGIGLNVAPFPTPVPAGPGGIPATSLGDHGASTTDRTEVAGVLLARLGEEESRWRDAAGDLAAAGLLDAYRDNCGTLGRRVRVELPDGELVGTAVDVDSFGQLLLDVGGPAPRPISAGDVVHLRPN